MQTIKVKYHNCPHILQKTENGDFIDLYTAEDIKIRNFEFAKISLGLSMELPENTTGILVPRSSTFGRYGLIQTNHIGIIDNNYKGDNDLWTMPVYKLPIINKYAGIFKLLKELFIRPQILIPKGTRLCQFRIIKSMDEIELVSVERLNNNTRGGFGTSGV